MGENAASVPVVIQAVWKTKEAVVLAQAVPEAVEP